MKKGDKLSNNNIENTDPFEEYLRETDPSKRELCLGHGHRSASGGRA